MPIINVLATVSDGLVLAVCSVAIFIVAVSAIVVLIGITVICRLTKLFPVQNPGPESDAGRSQVQRRKHGALGAPSELLLVLQ